MALRVSKSLQNMLRNGCQVVFEDSTVFAVAKPANMLSVPGLEFREKTRSRGEEWTESIMTLYNKAKSNVLCPVPYSEAMEILKKQARNAPRQKEKFLTMLTRAGRIQDMDLKERLWKDLSELDHQLHAVDLESVPESLHCAADFAENMCGHKVHHVHRLDQETSGILLFAKNTVSAAHLARQFRDREVHKTYIALVHGQVADDINRIDAPLGADICRPRQKVDEINGKPSSTLISIVSQGDVSYHTRLSYFPEIPTEHHPFTMVELKPITGRTHQLRVHMAHLGHPIMGDTLYSPHDELTRQLGRLCLHAERITFQLPSTNTLCELSAVAVASAYTHVSPETLAIRDGRQSPSKNVAEEVKEGATKVTLSQEVNVEGSVVIESSSVV